MTVGRINPRKALYIKLGRGGEWEKECIDQGKLRLSYRGAPHQLCLQRRWDEVAKELRKAGKDSGTATRDTNQIQLFYESDKTVLWVTFSGDRMYWCFSEPKIVLLPDKLKTRPVVGQWSCLDTKRKLPLRRDQLSGRLLSIQGFRGTICSVKDLHYLVRKINGLEPEYVRQTREALLLLEERMASLIRSLYWKDFEILIDLIFRQAGWQRVSELGETQKTLDLDLISPLTSERFGVQIKTRASLSDLHLYQQRCAALQEPRRFFFVVHTPSADLEEMAANKPENPKTTLWLSKDIAHFGVKYGLADWVIAKAA